MTPKYSPYVITKKHAQNLHTQKNMNFSDPPPPKKKIEIQNFEPPKNSPSLRMYENI